MTDKTQKKEAKVKIKALYNSIESQSLWGVVFTIEGKDLIAEVSKAEAESMVAANRVEIVK